VRPALVAIVAGVEVARLECPTDLGARDWLLGVMAVQLDGAGARLRAHLTGRVEPIVVPLAPGVVHIAFGDGGALPDVGAAEGFSVHRDGQALATTPHGPGRAFGHVFCRYLRSGVEDAGFDLTPFLELPEGVKYRRIVSEPLRPGEVVSYAFTGPRPSRPGR
jgi:hypothetical protein